MQHSTPSNAGRFKPSSTADVGAAGRGGSGGGKRPVTTTVVSPLPTSRIIEYGVSDPTGQCFRSLRLNELKELAVAIAPLLTALISRAEAESEAEAAKSSGNFTPATATNSESEAAAAVAVAVTPSPVVAFRRFCFTALSGPRISPLEARYEWVATGSAGSAGGTPNSSYGYALLSIAYCALYLGRWCTRTAIQLSGIRSLFDRLPQATPPAGGSAVVTTKLSPPSDGEVSPALLSFVEAVTRHVTNCRGSASRVLVLTQRRSIARVLYEFAHVTSALAVFHNGGCAVLGGDVSMNRSAAAGVWRDGTSSLVFACDIDAVGVADLSPRLTLLVRFDRNAVCDPRTVPLAAAESVVLVERGSVAATDPDPATPPVSAVNAADSSASDTGSSDDDDGDDETAASDGITSFDDDSDVTADAAAVHLYVEPLPTHRFGPSL